MKGSAVLVFLFCFALPSHNVGKLVTITDLSLVANETDVLLDSDTIVIRQAYPWSADNPCELGNYQVQGVIPVMYDTLVALALEQRLTNGFNSSKARSNYHGADYTSNGVEYSAAVDISVRCLKEDEIRNLLDELAMRGFAAWYRKKGEDGWNGSNHIHAIWVAAPLKAQLADQVKNWLLNRNGLTSDKTYGFWAPKPEATERIRSAFSQSNPSYTDTKVAWSDISNLN